jgi:hypothetical protein
MFTTSWMPPMLSRCWVNPIAQQAMIRSDRTTKSATVLAELRDPPLAIRLQPGAAHAVDAVLLIEQHQPARRTDDPRRFEQRILQ